MNKLVKKSLAGVLAGVMAATSLVGSISAFALTEEDVAFKKEATVGTKVSFEYKEDATAAQDVYAFKTGKADKSIDSTNDKVKYTISFSSDAAYKADTAELKNVRKDSAATLSVYTEEVVGGKKSYNKETKDYAGTAINVKSYTAGPKTKRTYVGTNTSILKTTTESTVDGTMDIVLKEETTYFFTVDKADFGSYTEKNAKNEDVTTRMKAYLTINNYVAPAESDFDITPTGTDVEFEIGRETLPDGTYYKTTVTGANTASAQYKGAAGDIVVPETVAKEGKDYIITEVTGVAGLKSRVKSLTLSKNVTKVGGFSNCPYLAKVVFNDGLQTIDASAFANCTALTGKLELPATVTTIGNRAFFNTNYTSADIKNEKATVGTEALGIVEQANLATSDPYDYIKEVKEGFFITAPAKAAAVIAYGKANAITVIDPAACTHVFGDAVKTPATIYAAGKETKTCAVCGKTEETVIAQKKVAIASVKSSKKGAITVKTKAVTDKVTAYKVQYATKKDFSNAKTVTVKTTKKALSKTITGLKAGKKYYVRVKAVNGSKKSAFTATKSVKVKK